MVHNRSKLNQEASDKEITNSNGFIKKFSDFIERQIKPIFRFIIYLRIQTIIALATYLVFTKVDQTIEVYRSIALDNNVYAAFIATISVSILTIFVWYTSRFLTLEHSDIHEKNKSHNFLTEWSPRIIGIIPFFTLILGVLEAWNQSINEKARAFLIIWIILNLIIGVLIFFLFIYRTELFSPDFYLASKEKGQGLFAPEVEIGLTNLAYIVFSTFSLPLITAATDSKFSLGVMAIAILSPLLNIVFYFWYQKLWIPIIGWCITSLLISAIFVSILPPTAIPTHVGAISVVAIAFTILVVVFSTIYNWGLQNKIPALTILISLVVLSSLFNFNDNHRFRQFAKSQNSSLPTLEESFKQWLAKRPDRDKYLGKPYPVYIASAQGGGIFAAYHAATAFAKLTEYFPSFPQHVFAISGVSGGSLGASAFASLIKESDSNTQNISKKACQIFEQNLLSPLLALGFFSDLIQRFIPFSIYDWDRANGLEIAFENAWDKLQVKNRENPFKLSFYKHWQPQGVAPALVLNTTVVESGKRLVISPFKILLPTQENIALDENNLDLRLSTAAGLSARFPFVTPVGWYQRGSDGSKLRLADGGYFDNSGIPTAIDIGRALQKMKEYDEKSFELIYLATVDQPQNSSEKPLKSSGMNEVFSPIRALFHAREARSLSAIQLSTYTLNEGITDPFKLKFRTLMLQKVSPNIKLPLGWQLSATSKTFIDEQTPEPSQCNVEDFKQAFNSNTSIIDVKKHNSCVAKSIGDDLS